MGSGGAESLCFHELKEKLESRTAAVAVVGLGYVGLPLVSTLHSAGFPLVGFDIDESKIQMLLAGTSYIRHINSAVVKNLAESGSFTPTSEISALKDCDVFVLCLPTPVGSHNEPDMSYVLNTTRRLSSVMKQGALVVLESTTYPGATDTDMANILGESDRKLGKDFFLAYSPEREDPGNEIYATHNIPKLVGGVDDLSGTLVELLYRHGGFEHTVRVSSSRVAECSKLLENTYRAVNIALVNELKQVFESMDVNIWEVIDAAATKPFGFQRFDPGPGIGGHCIPVDPFYLTWKGKETGTSCGFIELAALVNAKMPMVVVEKTKDALNEECKSVKGSRIMLLGIAYKPNVDDMREAPSLEIWEKLLDLGAIVQFCDPFVGVVCHTRKHPRLSQQKSVEVAEHWFVEETLDAVIVITNHSTFGGFDFLKGFKGPVIDTRNCVRKDLGLNIVRA